MYAVQVMQVKQAVMQEILNKKKILLPDPYLIKADAYRNLPQSGLPGPEYRENKSHITPEYQIIRINEPK